MQIYHYHRTTSEYLGETKARVSPLDPQNYLIPACSTEFPPPSTKEHEVAVFEGSTWTIKPDYRGQWYDGRNPVIVSEIGPLPDGYTKNQKPLTKADVLEKLFADIDSETASERQQPFEYAGNLYYPDNEFIQGVFLAVTSGLLPADYTEVWKTAEKEKDGINNVYTTLDVSGITGLAAAYLQSRKAIWAKGENKKKSLKIAFFDESKTVEDLKIMEVNGK